MTITALAALPTHDTRRAVVAEKLKTLDGLERVAFLEAEVKAAVAERQLAMLDSISVRYGSPPFDANDPNDDGEKWHQIGATNGLPGISSSNPALRTLEDLRRARDDGRRLALGNKFAIGAHKTRVNYTVGYGLTWSAVPKDIKAEKPELTRLMADTIKRIQKQENWGELEKEFVRRADRDGEAFLRIYPQADRAPRFRFVEPEQVTPPPGDEGSAPFGVVMDNGEATGYWVVESGDRPSFVSAKHRGLDVRDGEHGIPAVIHHKANVDANAHRGWPSFYAMKGSLYRAEKLLQNMSWVAALQAAIALIKKYENASQDQIQAMLASQTQLTVTNSTTGQSTEHVEMKPGTIVHGPKGVTYEAPISSVNASNNVEVLQAELRAAAVSVNQPEYLFSGDSSGAAYSSQLVAESPFVKQVESDQWCFFVPLHSAMEAALVHEEFMDRLPRGACAAYDLQAEFPNPVVRDVLQDRQGKQILHSMGVISRKTMRAMEGLDDTTEERNIDTENARGYVDVRKGAVEADKPPPGSTPGGPGGVDHKPAEPGKPGRPPEKDAPAESTQEARALEAMAPMGEPVPSLNGSQIAALQTLLKDVHSGALPKGAAIELVMLAFPGFSAERVATMIGACGPQVQPPQSAG
jgi:hypothetical protein